MVENINHILYIIKLNVNLDFFGVLYFFLKFCSIISGTQKKISHNKYEYYIILFIHLFNNLPLPPPKKMKLNKITKTVEKK